MGETLQQYRDRTGFMADSLARTGGFRTSGGLTKKVAPDGYFVPFYGDTVIFMLPQLMIRWLAGLRKTVGCNTVLVLIGHDGALRRGFEEKREFPK